MSTNKALADALYREEIARARAMDPADKLLEGPRLFERVRRVMLDGIRHQRLVGDHAILLSSRDQAHFTKDVPEFAGFSAL